MDARTNTNSSALPPVLRERHGHLSSVMDVAPAHLRLRLRGQDDDLLGAVLVGLTHRSYLYEHRTELPGLTTAHLDALASLGLMYLRRAVAVDSYQRDPRSAAGPLAQRLLHVPSLLPAWATGLPWLMESAILGKGYDGEPLSQKMAAALFQQLLGVLCLVEEDAASSLVASFLRQNEGDVTNPRTALYQALAPQTPQFTESWTGPGEARLYTCVVTDDAGRTAAGTGGSKKTAARAASLRFLQLHCPDRLPKTPIPNDAAPLPLPVTDGEHFSFIDLAKSRFRLDDKALGLLSQALIHRSWVYEHPDLVQRAHQQDNQALAFLGSHVLAHEQALAICRNALSTPDLRQQGIATALRSSYTEAFGMLGAQPALLLAKGMARTNAGRDEAEATAFTALCGAVYTARDHAARLSAEWPSPWVDAWEVVAPRLPRQEAVTARLSGYCHTMRLTVDYAYESEGPGHDLRYRATAVLDSDALGGVMLSSGEFRKTKAQAKDSAAEPVLTLIDTLARVTPTRPKHYSPELLRFLVGHQAAALADSPSLWRSLGGKQLLGLHLLNCPADLLAWAEAVDHLVGKDLPLPPLDVFAGILAEGITRTANESRGTDVLVLAASRIPDREPGPLALVVHEALRMLPAPKQTS